MSTRWQTDFFSDSIKSIEEDEQDEKMMKIGWQGKGGWKL